MKIRMMMITTYGGTPVRLLLNFTYLLVFDDDDVSLYSLDDRYADFLLPSDMLEDVKKPSDMSQDMRTC